MSPERRLIVFRITCLAVEAAVINEKRDMDTVIEWAVEFGRRYDITRREAELALEHSPAWFFNLVQR